MKRHQINLPVLVALALLLASAAAWPLSYYAPGGFKFEAGGKGPNGGIDYDRQWEFNSRFHDGMLELNLGHSSDLTEWDIPFWKLIAIAALFLISVRPRQELHLRARKRGTCRNCGYDLRATPERCPECGKISQEAVE